MIGLLLVLSYYQLGKYTYITRCDYKIFSIITMIYREERELADFGSKSSTSIAESESPNSDLNR